MTTEKLIELGVDKDIAGKIFECIEGELADLKYAHENELSRLKKEKDNIQIDFEISRVLSEVGVWSERAVYALIDFGSIKIENGEVVGVCEEIERIKAECSVLFKSTAAPRIVTAANHSVADSESAVRTAMGI